MKSTRDTLEVTPVLVINLFAPVRGIKWPTRAKNCFELCGVELVYDIYKEEAFGSRRRGRTGLRRYSNLGSRTLKEIDRILANLSLPPLELSNSVVRAFGSLLGPGRSELKGIVLLMHALLCGALNGEDLEEFLKEALTLPGKLIDFC